MVFGPAGTPRFVGAWAAPAAPKTMPKGRGLRPPPSGMVFGAAGAAGPKGRPAAALASFRDSKTQLGPALADPRPQVGDLLKV